MTSPEGTRKQQRGAQREARRQREEEARQRQRRQRWIWWGGGGMVTLALLGGVVFATRAQAAPTIDGVRCNTSESLAYHIHQHLVIYGAGTPVTIPAGIGIRQDQAVPCLFWLHTHTPDGVIHVESPTQTTYTLGQFFDIWGQPLSRTQVTSLKTDRTHQLRAYVNGRLYRGDPRAIPLTAHELITLEYGPPWVAPPSFTFPQGK